MAGAPWALGAALAFSLEHIALTKGSDARASDWGTATTLVAGAGSMVLAALVVVGAGVLLEATAVGVLAFAGAGRRRSRCPSPRRRGRTVPHGPELRLRSRGAHGRVLVGEPDPRSVGLAGFPSVRWGVAVGLTAAAVAVLA